MHGKREISVWFFIGVLLLIYGILIAGAGVQSQPDPQVVFSEHRIGIWWGLLLFVLGLIYSIAFRPKKN
jgi:hypothetical protein